MSRPDPDQSTPPADPQRDQGGVRCPRCRGEAVVAGGFAPHGASRPVFLPQYCGAPSYSGIIPPQLFRACLSCGLLWSAVDPRGLRALIARCGGELGLQHLDEIDHGPYRDLPDTDLARAIGDKIAELDATARTQPQSAMVRRCRELYSATWDQAHQDAREWPRLSREDKLERFGWSPNEKKKAPLDDFDSPFI